MATAQSYEDKWVQEPPMLSNPFTSDTTLLDILKTKLLDKDYDLNYKLFEKFGQRCITEIKDLGDQSELHPPKLHQFDAWQRRIDDIETCPAWKRLTQIAAEEGLIATGYQRKNNPSLNARLLQFAKLYLFDSNSAIYDCPLAMTDGAARLIEATLHHNKSLPENVRQELINAFQHLTSTDPAQFWTSGQWMTEKAGGSDVSRATATIALPQSETEHHLRGVKFFTSATDSNMTFTLARIVRQDSDLEHLHKIPLSLFFVRIRNDRGLLNNIKVLKLKNKLGTKAVPTAELELNNTKATLVGTPGRGVHGISYMLTVTRSWNSMSACSRMRRIMALAQDYATKRSAFGRKLADIPLHSRILARLEAETRACTHFTFDIVERMGKFEWNEMEQNNHSEDANSLLLRLMVPILKMYTARQGISVATEGIECFGGQGYIEDTGIPEILRTMHVLPIWEGTTNVLSHDVLRVLVKHGNALEMFSAEIAKILSNKTRRVESLSEQDDKYLKFSVSSIESAQRTLEARLKKLFSKGQKQALQMLEVSVRDLSFSLAHIYVASLLLTHVMNNRSEATPVSVDIQTLYQYVITHEPLCRFHMYEEGSAFEDIVKSEKLISADIGSGKKDPQVVFTPFGIKSNL
jgi:alkylation response protein AidB-like acyl-CoA dehydrogenase